MRRFACERIELLLQRADAPPDQRRLRAIGEVAGFERLEQGLQIVDEARVLPFERGKPPSAEIVHPGLQLAEPVQRVDTLLHRRSWSELKSSGSKPRAEADEKRFDRRLDGEIEKRQAARSDERGRDKTIWICGVSRLTSASARLTISA